MAYLETTKLKNAEGTIVSPATEESLTLLKRIFYLLKPLGQVSGTNRLSIDINTGTVATVTTVTTVTTVSTVTSVTNMANLGGVAGFDIMKAASRTAYNTGIRSNIS